MTEGSTMLGQGFLRGQLQREPDLGSQATLSSNIVPSANESCAWVGVVGLQFQGPG